MRIAFPFYSIGHFINQPDNRTEFEITRIENPPLRLLLGKIAVNTITSKLESIRTDLDNWRAVAESAVL